MQDKWLILLSNNEIREVYRRPEDGRLMIATVTSPNDSKGFVAMAEIKQFYMRHFGLTVDEVVQDGS